jgi:predicted RNase H-like nuclease (RuvC/YqgF family)
MEPNYSKIFNKQIMQAVSAYCKLNNIEDIDGFIKKCFNTGFNIEKYGLLGKSLNEGEKDLKTVEVEEKHVIKEVIVEVIKEVLVEKPNEKVNLLQQTIQNLTSEVRELKKKNEELEKQSLDTPKQLGKISAKFHSSSNINDDLYK